jgi:NADH-quinone oxidoreductase subunit A
MQSDQLSYVPILLQFFISCGLVGTIIVSGKLGPKRKSEIKNKNFECGVEGICTYSILCKILSGCYFVCII